MLWLVIGGIGCGKSAFADELAHAVGREGIRLSCPSFPCESDEFAGMADANGFYRTMTAADETLPSKINAINLEPNFYRAERRVVVVDGLAGWLRASFARTIDDGQGSLDSLNIEVARFRETIEAILSFEGKIIVVTEEPAAGLNLSYRELEYVRRLAEANRVLLEASRSVYRMTAGMAVEIKGYRLKGRFEGNEDLYADR